MGKYVIISYGIISIVDKDFNRVVLVALFWEVLYLLFNDIILS